MITRNMRVRPIARFLTVLSIAATAVIACREDGSTGPPRECPAETFLGSFTGTTTGDATYSFTGCAYYTVAPVDDKSRFGMVLTDGVPVPTNGAEPSATASIKLQRVGGKPSGTIAAGSGPNDFFGTIYLSGDRQYVITGGTVTVTLRSGDQLKGELTLTGTDANTGATITVTGSFLAACVGGYPVCGGAAG